VETDVTMQVDPEAAMRWEEVVTTDTEIMGGTPVFTGTRVPAESLIQHLSAGDSLDDFLERFPRVKREQATALLQFALSAVVSGMVQPGEVGNVGP
jgi:uncharacterized protein (DUF433 family)